MTAIPLVDLRAAHAEVADEVDAGLAKIFDTAAFIGGRAVTDFEQAFAAYLGAGHCVGVGNGTDALELALRALGIGRGDDVVLPAHTFIATAEAVERCGAAVVLCDVTEDTMLVDPVSLEAAMTPRTAAVMPVHLYGQAAPMEAVLKIAERQGAAVVEDAAQSQGATRGGRHTGTFGSVAGTSFYPGKNLGAAGDAGAVVTGDAALAARVRRLSQHGSDRKYEHTEVGVNSRLDAVQAVVLSAKLRRVDAWNARRGELAERYARLLRDVPGVRTPVVDPANRHVWHLYVVRVPERDRVLQHLQERGVGAGIHYPRPVHAHEAFRHLGHGPGSFPVAERVTREILSLPLHPHLSEADQDRVVDELAAAMG